MTSVLAHSVAGDGPPLLLLNGGLMSYGAWDAYAAALSPSFRVVRCDFRGQLLSPGDPPATLAGHVDDVLGLMDTLDIESAHVAGTSFGALVGIVAAATAPPRVRSLTAITATDRMTREMDEGTSKLREACREALDGGDGGRVLDLINRSTWSAEYLSSQSAVLAARRQVVAKLPASWFKGLDGLLAAILALDLRPLLPSIAVPTLVVGGDRDVTFPIEHSRALAAAIRGARLTIVEGGPHGLVIERAPEVIDAVGEFAAEAEAERAARPEVAS